MPASKDQKQPVKPKKSPGKPAKSAVKSAATPAANKAGAKKKPAERVKDIAAAGGVAGAISNVMSDDMKNLLVDQLGNVLYDLLKSGWHEAAPALAEWIGRLPMLQFVSLAHENTHSQETATETDFDEWMNSVLAVAMLFRKRATEIDRIVQEYGTSHEDVAAFTAERLIDAAGRGPIDAEDLLFEIRTSFHSAYLDRIVPSASATAGSKGPKL